MLNYVIYTLSIAIQISGALLLMITALSTQRDNVIRRFAAKGLIFHDDQNIVYNIDKYRNTYKEAYLSKLAFLYIAAGYLLSIFASSVSEHKLEVAFATIYIAVIIILLSHLTVHFYVKYNKTVNKEITEEDLDRIGIEADFEESSNDDISGLFKS